MGSKRASKKFGKASKPQRHLRLAHEHRSVHRDFSVAGTRRPLKLVTNSSPKSDRSRAFSRKCESGKARQAKGFRFTTSKFTRWQSEAIQNRSDQVNSYERANHVRTSSSRKQPTPSYAILNRVITNLTDHDSSVILGS